jgi:hypothetical protein
MRWRHCFRNRSSDFAVDSLGLGSEIDLLPNADTARFIACRRSLPLSIAPATAEPRNRRLTTLGAGP